MFDVRKYLVTTEEMFDFLGKEYPNHTLNRKDILSSITKNNPSLNEMGLRYLNSGEPQEMMDKFSNTKSKGLISKLQSPKQNTGFRGTLVEQLVTGSPVTTNTECDLLPYGIDYDIKSQGVVNGRFLEKLAVSQVNWGVTSKGNKQRDCLKTTPFKETTLFKKTKYLIAIFDESPSKAHFINSEGNVSKIPGVKIDASKSIFLGWLILDLNKIVLPWGKTFMENMEWTYTKFQQAANMFGEEFVAFTMGSQQFPFSQIERKQVLHMKQAQNGKQSMYKCESSYVYPKKWNIAIEVLENYCF